jgi:glutamyl/glutaminyl-tRNA synthetase
MTNSIQTTDYSATVEACTNAVRQDINTVNKWQTAGDKVRAFFGTETAMLEVKAQFIADAILPAIDKRHSKALSVDLVRKNSKEFIAYDQGQRDSWEFANQCKKDARATCDTYFSRIVKYAFPKDKADNEPTSLKTKIQEQIADLIKKCEKSIDADFDLVATKQALQAVLTAVNK